MVGLSTSAVQRIELGTLELTEKILGRISAMTDVGEESLLRPERRLNNRNGDEYTKSDFDECQLRLKSAAVRHECERKKAELRRRIDVLLDAAFSKKRFPLVESDIWEALNKIRVVHGLERLTEDRLRADGKDPRPHWDSIAPAGVFLLFRENGVTEFDFNDNKQIAAWSAEWDRVPTGTYAYTRYNYGVFSSTVEDAMLKRLFDSTQSRTLQRARQKRGRA